MSVQQLGEHVNKMKFPSFVPVLTPFHLGRLAARKGMQPESCWPLDMLAGWANAGGVIRFSEEALVTTGWRSDTDVDYEQASIQ